MSDSPTPAVAGLVEAAGQLWPPGTQVRVLRRAGLGRTSANSREFLLVPHARRPRLLTPAGSPRAAAASVRRYSSALRPTERVTRAVIATVLRTGLLDALPLDRLAVSWPAGADPADEVETVLSEVYGQPVLVSLGVGPPRANRKPVLAVFARDGSSIGYVKIGENEMSKALVRREAAALEVVSSRPYLNVRTPQLVTLRTWRGLDLLCMTALPTSPRVGMSRRWSPVDAMREVARTTLGPQTPLGGTAFWRRLRGDAARVHEPMRRELFDDALDAVEERHGQRHITVGAWHGDWTPWNMSVVKGMVHLWDWERFDASVPVGFDLLHYRWQSRSGRRGVDAALESLVREGGDWLTQTDIQATGPESVVAAYLAELVSRYLLAAQEPAGPPLRGTADRSLATLCSSFGSLGNRVDIAAGLASTAWSHA